MYPVFDVTRRSTLQHVMQKTIATHTHRMWVVDDNERLIGVVSLTDMIRQFVPK